MKNIFLTKILTLLMAITSTYELWAETSNTQEIDSGYNWHQTFSISYGVSIEEIRNHVEAVKEAIKDQDEIKIISVYYLTPDQTPLGTVGAILHCNLKTPEAIYKVSSASTQYLFNQKNKTSSKPQNKTNP